MVVIVVVVVVVVVVINICVDAVNFALKISKVN
jgi:hypothetical protein